MAAPHIHWFLPTAGDSREVVSFLRAAKVRPPSLDYLTQVAQAADRLGFEAVLTPTGTHCEDAWLTTSALIGATSRLKFLVAFRPGSVVPTLAAQMAATFQRLSGGRLVLNVVTGGDAAEQKRFGDFLGHDERYERTDEFLQIVRGAWSGTPFDFEGEHYRVEGATCSTPPSPIPEVFFGGASPAAEEVAAKNVDVYLTWGEHPDQLKERVDRMREKAAAHGRTLRFGVRLNVITRDKAEDAWAEADRMLANIPDKLAKAASGAFANVESEGQRRMTALHGGDRAKLEIAPNLWAGFGLVRTGAGTALVGSHEQVAERITEYQGLGFDHFIMSGQPHLEEAYWFGEGVLPLLGTAPAAAQPILASAAG